jgi:phage tail-like protein
MPSSRNDPYKSFSFLVEIDGAASAGFTSVSGLAAEAEVIEYREGADRLTSTRKIPGLKKYTNVTLKRGFTTSRDLWDWWTTVRDGEAQRRTVAITLLDDAREPVARWILREAYPTKWELSELDASTNELVIESIELAHEGLELES